MLSIFPSSMHLTFRWRDQAANDDFLKMENVQLSGGIEIEKDQGKNNYFQLKEGSFASNLQAGLFKK